MNGAQEMAKRALSVTAEAERSARELAAEIRRLRDGGLEPPPWMAETLRDLGTLASAARAAARGDVVVDDGRPDGLLTWGASFGAISCEGTAETTRDAQAAADLWLRSNGVELDDSR